VSTKSRLEDDIKMDLRQVRLEDMGRIHVSYNRHQWRALLIQ
jgi:hypothetical protein